MAETHADERAIPGLRCLREVRRAFERHQCGGKTLIKMEDLRACIEALGLDGVSTYIASGNVLFQTSQRSAAKLEAKIERGIEQRFRLPVKVVVLDRAAYGRIVEAIPKSWVGDESLRANVAFVRRGIDAKQVVRELEPDASIEEAKAINGAILGQRNAMRSTGASCGSSSAAPPTRS